MSEHTQSPFPHPVQIWQGMFRNVVTYQLTFPENLPDRLPAQLLPTHMRGAARRRKAEFLAGQLCARASLQHAGFPAIMPARNPDRTPVWPPGCAGSISHSRNKAMAVVAPTTSWQSLGVDIEHQARPDLAKILHPEVLTTTEAQLMSHHFSSLLFERAFSLKEAAFKAIYPLTARMFEFSDIEIISAHSDGRITLKVLRNLSPSWPEGHTICAYHEVLEDIVHSISGVLQNI